MVAWPDAPPYTHARCGGEDQDSRLGWPINKKEVPVSLKRTIAMLAATVLVASVGFGPAWSCDKDKKAEATAAANHAR